MTHVFVSYARADGEMATAVTTALGAAGYDAWWDASLPPHKSYADVIEERLGSARAVLVLWSAEAVKSDWVRAEADFARQQGKLIQAVIDGAALPLPFNQLHCVSLKGVGKLAGAPAWTRILASLRELSGVAEPVAQPPPPVSTRGDESPGVAVMRFSWRGATDDDWFAEAVAEDIIAGLSRSKVLRVLSRQSSFAYGAAEAEATTIGRDLNIDYVLRGSVARAGQKLRISVELASCGSHDVVWSSRYDRSIDDLFAVQEDITSMVCATLEPVLMEREQQRAVRADAKTLAHWDLFVRGRWHFWRGTRRHTAEGERLLRQALEIKPDDPGTLCMLAHCLFGELWAGWSASPAETMKTATDCARRAVRADADDPHAHNTLGVALSMQGRLEQGLAEQKRAVELNPFYAAAIGEMGRMYAFLGRPDEAIERLDRAIALSPMDPHLNLFHRAKALAHLSAKRFDEAVACARVACAQRPDFFFHQFLLAACLAASGDVAHGRLAYAEGAAQMPVYPLEVLKFGHPFARPEDLERFTSALAQCGWSPDGRGAADGVAAG